MIDIFHNAMPRVLPGIAVSVLAMLSLSACGGGSGGSGPLPPPAAGIIEFAASNYQANETDASVRVDVKRTNGSSGPVSVNISTSGGTAAAGSDFTDLVVTLQFADGDSAMQSVTLDILDDKDDEPIETVVLSLGQVTGGAAIGTQNSATISIIDNDPAFPALGGTASGVSGSGLTLTLNGTDDIPVDVDGPFTLATSFMEGTPYTVTITNQPWDPAQDCTVNNSVGTMGDSDISDIAVACSDIALQSILMRREAASQFQGDLVLIREDGQSTIQTAMSADEERYRDIVNGRVIYERRTSASNVDLYSVLLDGTQTVPLAVSPANEFYGGATAAGIIVFQSDGNLYSVGVDGTGMTQLTDAAEFDQVRRVTADGSVIFERAFGLQRDIYAIDYNGDNLTVLAASMEDESAHTSTPTGRVVFSRYDGSQYDLYSVSLDGTDEQVIAADPVENDDFQALLPNDVVVWRRGIPGNDYDLFLSRSDGSGETVLANSLGDEHFVTSMPDGRLLYLSAVGGQADLYAVRVDGTSRTALAASQEDEYFIGFTQDPSMVFYRGRQPDPIAVHAIDLDGFNSRLVADEVVFENNVVIAGRRGSNRIVFAHSDGGQHDLFSVDTDGGDLRRLTDTAEVELPLAVTSTDGIVYGYNFGALGRVGTRDSGDVPLTDPQDSAQLLRLVDP